MSLLRDVRAARSSLNIAQKIPASNLRPRPWTELLLVVVLFLVYKAGRVLVDGRVDDAFFDADEVWRLERFLHLPNEVHIQHLLLTSAALVRGANLFYAVVHFPATVAFLLYTYVYRPAFYVRFRRMLAVLTAGGLVIHFAFPLSPPRMLEDIGLIDTAAQFGPSVYGPPQTDTLSNQFAAMPSLHVGWALVVAAGLITAGNSRWRWLWLAHPVVTLLVVVGTANHYWLDGVVAAVLVAALLLIGAPERNGTDQEPVGPSTAIDGPRIRIRQASAADHAWAHVTLVGLAGPAHAHLMRPEPGVDPSP